MIMQFDILTLVFVLISILISMTLHEAMHAYAGYWLGDDTAKVHGRLTINPLAHIDIFTTILLPLILVAIGAPPFGVAKPVPFDPSRVKWGEYGAALVGVAGPTTNLALALLGGLALGVLGSTMSMGLLGFITVFTFVNLSFFLFNMIPFPPLDGSRVLYALAPDFVRRAMEYIEGLGIFALVGFFFIFYTFLSGPFERILNATFNFITGGALTG